MTDINSETVERQGYKKTKLGSIPVDWEFVKLGNLGDLTSGTTPLRAKEERYFKNGIHFWVKTTDLNNNLIVTSEEKVTDIALEETSLKILPQNTILIAMYGGYKQIGRTGLLKTEAAINQALSALIIKNENIEPVFLLNWLNAKVGLWKRFAASSRKDPNITKSDVGHFPVLLPPLPEQQKIAKILSTWDKGIEKLKALIEAKEARKKGLMQRLLTGKVRLKGFEGKWKEVRLGKIFSERKETKYNDLPLLAITGDRGVIYRDELEKRDSSNADKSKYKRICPGDIGYNTMRLWQGRSAVSSLEGIVSPAYTIIIPQENIDVQYMGYLFQLPKIIHTFWRHSQGLVSDTLNCKFPNFARIKILVPSTKLEQEAIAKLFLKSDKEINILKSKLAALETQKKGMMQQLLTGKTRVK